MPDDTTPAAPPDSSEGEDYPPEAKVAAGWLTTRSPLKSLLASEYLLSKETDPAKRRSLKTWSSVSIALLIAGLAVAFILLAVFIGKTRQMEGPFPDCPNPQYDCSVEFPSP